MQKQYTIRTAKDSDKDQIHRMFRESIAREKRLVNPAIVHNEFIEEFVDKLIEKGQMLVVENNRNELELIGEVHDYLSAEGQEEDLALKEISFFSRIDSTTVERETSLVNWLFGEIQSKHSNVFRVELNAPVSSTDSVDHYKRMGLRVEGNYQGRLGANPGQFKPLVPLSWANPSFN